MDTSPARLINAEAVRAQIKRFFSGSWREIYGELLQNAQRAGATQLQITTEQENPDSCIITITDNGQGIADIEGFETLLCIGESEWDKTVTLNQQPMGMGIQALLASKDVQMLRLESNGMEVLIDTAKWWDDIPYAESWKQRVRASSIKTGLTLSFIADPKLITRTLHLFEVKADNTLDFTNKGIARGYEGILEVTVNGTNAPTEPPQLSAFKHTLIRTHFDGCPLTIGTYESVGQGEANTINWYGQLIKVGETLFPFYLDVRAGRPVDMKAPTRQGVIENEKWERLLQTVKDELRTYFLKFPSVNITHTRRWFHCLSLEERAEVPFTLGYKWREPDAGNDSEDFDKTGNTDLLPLDQLYTKPSINVLMPDGETLNAEEGYTSFGRLLGDTYTLAVSHPKAQTRTIWWKPGNLIVERGDAYDDYGGTRFYDPGEWGIGTDNRPPTEWLTVPAGTNLVLALETNCWDVDNASILTCIAPLPFYDEDWAMIGFYGYNDEASYDQLVESYRNSIEANVRDLIGDCVPSQWEFWHVQAFAPQGEQVTNIAINREDGIILNVTFSDGTTKLLKTR